MINELYKLKHIGIHSLLGFARLEGVNGLVREIDQALMKTEPLHLGDWARSTLVQRPHFHFLGQ